MATHPSATSRTNQQGVDFDDTPVKEKPKEAREIKPFEMFRGQDFGPALGVDKDLRPNVQHLGGTRQPNGEPVVRPEPEVDGEWADEGDEAAAAAAPAPPAVPTAPKGRSTDDPEE